MDTFDQSQHLPYTLHKSFLLHFSRSFTLLETIKRDMLKHCVSSIFSVKEATQKFTNFDVFFKCLLI